MNKHLEDIRILILDEISGKLSEAGREALFHEISVNEDARAMRDDMLSVLNTPAVQEYLKSEPFEDPADKIISRIHVQKRKKVVAIRIVTATAAAAVIALLTIPTLFKSEFSERKDKNLETTQIAINKQQIQLKMANGQVINLNTDTSQVVAGNALIKTTNKTLTYTTTAVNSAAEYATLNVPPGKDYTINLSDGSQVQLNAATSIRFPLAFKTGSREVYINGEAYLKIAKNAKQPFIVHLPHSTVRVLGTEFNVNTYDSGVARIALVEGAVKVIGKTDSLQLTPGQEAVASNKISAAPFDETDVLSWRLGKFLFSNARLDEVCRVIPRLYGISLELDNKEVAGKRFSGVIDRHQPVENVLKALKATNGIDYYTDKSGVFHIK
jgi:ferric-dicitrate binding protein FerR (iron transport regulator)